MSDNYLVSARKYRPSTFRSVVGQQNLTSTLKGAIESGRLAHAYLFCGSRGVGKTSCARIFAKTINCLSPTADGEACGECESCRAIDRGNSFNLMELDAASNNKVDDLRAVIEQVNIPPQVGKYRVFIIDEVHMLSSQAFNAFLKTLEEPPSYVIFILATTEKHKVIPTILSRCQIYDFKRITINDMVDHLAYVASQEGIKADRKALGVIARKADGAMRDALSIFDQVATSCHGDISYEAVLENLNVLDYDYFFRLVDTFAKGDAGSALLLYKEIRDKGFDSHFFVNSLAQHIRDLMVAADPRTVSLLETPDDVGQRLVEQSKSLPLQWYFAAMRLLNDCDLNYRTASNKQLLVELTLIRLCQLLSPAQPPFDNSDRKVALRKISEPVRATNVTKNEDAAVKTEVPPVQPKPESAPGPEPSGEKKDPVVHPRPVAGRGRPSSFNLKNTVQADTGSLERKSGDFTDAQFLEAWKEYAHIVPEKQILVSSIRGFEPVRGENLMFEVLVDNPMQVQAIESELPKLLPFLRQKLGNDYVSIKASLNPDKEIVKILSPQQFLEKTVSNNPELGEFLKDMEIELV